MEEKEDLSLDNVVAEENTLFADPDDYESEDDSDETEENDTTDDDSEDEQDDQESVGGDEDNNDDDSIDPEFDDGGESSAHFYSSIATALANEGVFENLSEEDLEDIQDAEDFKALIDKEVAMRIDGTTARVGQALTYGMTPPEIVQYENTIKFLDNIKEEYLKEESDQAEDGRKRLIFQDYVNKGFTPEKAMKMVEKSLAAGTDIEDALEALEENKKFYKTAYKAHLDALKKEEANRQKFMERQERMLVSSVMDTDEPFEGIRLDKQTKAKVLDVIMKPSVKGEDGKYYTKLQDYQRKNPNDFLHKIGVIYTLTDGFKDIDKFVGKKVKQKVNKNMRDLERKLSNQHYHGSSPRYVGNGVNKEVSSGSRFSLDI